MTDEVKLKAECRDKISRAGMTMIAEKKVENQLVDDSSNQSRDVLSVLRTSSFVCFKVLLIYHHPKSNQILVTPRENYLMKKYWTNALHFFSLEQTLFPSL